MVNRVSKGKNPFLAHENPRQAQGADASEGTGDGWSKALGTVLHNKWKLSQIAQEVLSWAKLGEDHLLKVVRQDLKKGDKMPVGSELHEVCWGDRIKWVIFGGANTVLDNKGSLRKKKMHNLFPVLRMVPYQVDQANLVTKSQ